MEDKSSIFSDMQSPETPASYLQRIGADLIDFALNLLLIVAFYLLTPKAILAILLDRGSWSTYVVVIVLLSVYRCLFLLIYGRTLGMMICKIKYLNQNLQPLSQKEKLIATFAVRTASIKYYVSNSN